MIKKSELEALRTKYPEGTAVELIHMDDPQSPPEGCKGVVKSVDDIGTIHVAWDNGSSLGLIPNLDEFKRIEGGAL